MINVRNGKPVGGIKKLEYTKGDQVRFRVSSDVADEIHVHGYDFHKDVPRAARSASASRRRSRACSWSSSKSRGEQIAELRVKPS